MIDLSPSNIEPIQSDSKMKSYFCPHCHKPLMKGNVKRLNMTCPHCQTLINSDENDLVVPDVFSEEVE